MQLNKKRIFAKSHNESVKIGVKAYKRGGEKLLAWCIKKYFFVFLTYA